MKVHIAARARADIERLRAFLLPISQTSATRAVKTILTATASLSELSERGKTVIDDDARELIVRFGKGAYIVRYMISKERGTVFVQRIWHSREERT